MISSVTLPNVALTRPPIRGPVCSASCSVARPISPGERHDRRGRRQEDRQVSGAPSSRMPIATGTSTSSQSSEGRTFTARSLEAQTE